MNGRAIPGAYISVCMCVTKKWADHITQGRPTNPTGLFTFETARSETPDNITFRLTNMIPERIIFVSRGITVYGASILKWYRGRPSQFSILVFLYIIHVSAFHGHLQVQRNLSTGQENPLGLQKVEALRISRHSAHEVGKVVSPTHRLPVPSRRYTWHSFLLKAEPILGLQCGRKN